jgi:hypothetical protein
LIEPEGWSAESTSRLRREAWSRRPGSQIDKDQEIWKTAFLLAALDEVLWPGGAGMGLYGHVVK